MPTKERSFYVVNIDADDHSSMLHSGVTITKALQFDLDGEFELWQHETGRSMTERMIHINHELYTFSTVGDMETARGIVSKYRAKGGMQFIVDPKEVINSDERKEQRKKWAEKRAREAKDDGDKNERKKKKPKRPKRKKITAVEIDDGKDAHNMRVEPLLEAKEETIKHIVFHGADHVDLILSKRGDGRIELYRREPLCDGDFSTDTKYILLEEHNVIAFISYLLDSKNKGLFDNLELKGIRDELVKNCNLISRSYVEGIMIKLALCKTPHLVEDVITVIPKQPEIYLDEGEEYYDLIEEKLFPLLRKKITHMKFEFGFNEPLGKLPTDLKSLKFHYFGKFNQPLPEFPSGLEVLKLPRDYNPDEPMGPFPDSLKFLKAKLRHYKFPLGKVPPNCVVNEETPMVHYRHHLLLKDFPLDKKKK